MFKFRSGKQDLKSYNTTLQCNYDFLNAGWPPGTCAGWCCGVGHLVAHQLRHGLLRHQDDCSGKEHLCWHAGAAAGHATGGCIRESWRKVRSQRLMRIFWIFCFWQSGGPGCSWYSLLGCSLLCLTTAHSHTSETAAVSLTPLGTLCLHVIF